MFRFLILSLVYSLTLISCKTFELKNASTQETTLQKAENLYFSSKEDYVYKTQMEIYGNQMSGILIIKKINETTHRVALTSDFGNKLVDFEISDNDFKINYIIPDLDKKMVKNFLKKDFKILLQQNYPISASFADATNNIYKSEQGKITSYLYYNQENQLLNKIIYTKNNKEKIHFNFEAKKAIFADDVEIDHKDLKINIKLNQIADN